MDLSTHRYTFKGITYEIREEPQRAKQLLRDFLHCEETKDWITIKNRITNGVMFGWLREITDGELAIGVKEVEIKKDFW